MNTFTATANPDDINVYGLGWIRITDANGEVDALGYIPDVDHHVTDAGIADALRNAGWVIAGDWNDDAVQVTATGDAAVRLTALGIA